MQTQIIKQAVHNMGGVSKVANRLLISASAIYKWQRLGRIPDIDLAEKVAEASGFPVALLRPRYEQQTAT
jgi:transcriptional regulator with XRE-family HTH domain